MGRWSSHRRVSSRWGCRTACTLPPDVLPLLQRRRHRCIAGQWSGRSPDPARKPRRSAGRRPSTERVSTGLAIDARLTHSLASRADGVSAQPLRRLPRGPTARRGLKASKDSDGTRSSRLPRRLSWNGCVAIRQSPVCFESRDSRGRDVAVHSEERQAELKPPSPPVSSPQQSHP